MTAGSRRIDSCQKLVHHSLAAEELVAVSFAKRGQAAVGVRPDDIMPVDTVSAHDRGFVGTLGGCTEKSCGECADEICDAPVTVTGVLGRRSRQYIVDFCRHVGPKLGDRRRGGGGSIFRPEWDLTRQYLV